MSVERRNHERLEVQDGAFAIPSLEIGAVGQIVNISQGGLAFSYVGSQNRSKESPALKISFRDGSFAIYRVPAKTVWDRPIPQAYSLDVITLRQCGVQFGELTEEQKFDLKCFIKNYTSPPEKPRE
jgi:hypothetical protein